MIKSKSLVAAAVIIIGSGCGGDKPAPAGDGIAGDSSKGCVQGVVRDAQTGERVALRTDEAKGEGIFVIVRNKLIPAQTLVEPEGNERTHLRGEYFACGIPLNESFPVVVKQNGYQLVEGVVRVKSHVAQETEASRVEDHERSHPTAIGNIDLYKVGSEAQDMAFNIYFRNETIEGATVQLTQTKDHALGLVDSKNSDHSFQIINPARAKRLSATTDSNGLALFKADQLTLGATYEYTVIPPVGGLNAELKEGTVTVGLKMAASEGTGVNLKAVATKPFEISIALDRAMKAPTLVQSSLLEKGYDADGRIELVFDTEIEITPASLEAMSASLNNNVKAMLKDPNGKGSVKAIVSGRRLIIEPIWDTKPDRDEEPTVAVRYNGVAVRPKGETAQDLVYKVGAESLSVSIFDKIN